MPDTPAAGEPQMPPAIAALQAAGVPIDALIDIIGRANDMKFEQSYLPLITKRLQANTDQIMASIATSLQPILQTLASFTPVAPPSANGGQAAIRQAQATTDAKGPQSAEEYLAMLNGGASYKVDGGAPKPATVTNPGEGLTGNLAPLIQLAPLALELIKIFKPATPAASSIDALLTAMSTVSRIDEAVYQRRTLVMQDVLREMQGLASLGAVNQDEVRRMMGRAPLAAPAPIESEQATPAATSSSPTPIQATRPGPTLEDHIRRLSRMKEKAA